MPLGHSEEEETILRETKNLNPLNKAKLERIYSSKEMGMMKMDYLASIGIEFTVLTTELTLLTAPELTGYILTQNWVKVALCVVGLILALTGIGLLIARITKTVQNGIKWHSANVVTRRNEKDLNDFERWLSVNNFTKNINSKPSNHSFF